MIGLEMNRVFPCLGRVFPPPAETPKKALLLTRKPVG
jgi:hypothetical protein